jgi:hypothetical protein
MRPGHVYQPGRWVLRGGALPGLVSTLQSLGNLALGFRRHLAPTTRRSVVRSRCRCGTCRLATLHQAWCFRLRSERLQGLNSLVDERSFGFKFTKC